MSACGPFTLCTNDEETSTPVPTTEESSACPGQYPIYIHYYNCDNNSTASGDWWFHQNDTSVHFNFSNHYLLGSFFLFLSVCLLTFCCLLVAIIMRIKRHGAVITAANNLLLSFKGGTQSPEDHAPHASPESIFTEDSKSQGEYMSNASTRSQASISDAGSRSQPANFETTV